MKQPPPEVFRDACGVTNPPTLRLEHRERGVLTHWTPTRPFALVGRDTRADLRLDDATVSHRHAYLQWIAGRLWFIDLDSRTGTFGRRGRQAAGLVDSRHGVAIGPFTLRLAEGDAEEEAPDIPANPLSPGPSANGQLAPVDLEFVEGVEEQARWTVDRPLTLVGRGAVCKVRLHSSAVSRLHCALLNTPGGLWLIDLLGRKGTRVNNRAVRWALLVEGDKLRVGPFVMRVCAAARRATPTMLAPARSVEAAPLPLGMLAPAPSLVAANGNELLMPLVAQFSMMQQQMFEQFQQTLQMVARMFGDLHREQMQLIRQELDRVQDITHELQGLQLELSRQPAAPPRTEPVVAREPAVPAPPPPAPPAAAAPPPSTSPPPDASVHNWLSQRLVALQQERQSRWQKILSALTGKAAEQVMP